MATIEFFYDIWSPHSYLASTRLAELAKRTGAEIKYRPHVHNEITALCGNPGPLGVSKKLNYILTDVGRSVGQYKIPLTLPSYFPFDSTGLQRALVAAEKIGGHSALVKATDALFAAVWGRGDDVREDAALEKVLSDAGLPGAQIVTESKSAETKSKLDANVKESRFEAGFTMK